MAAHTAALDTVGPPLPDTLHCPSTCVVEILHAMAIPIELSDRESVDTTVADGSGLGGTWR